MNIAKLLVAASAVTLLCGAASAATTNDAKEIELGQLVGRNAGPVLAVEELPPAFDPNFVCNVIWDNGLPDNAFAVRSADPGPNALHRFFAGDDFVLQPCRWNYIEAVEMFIAIGQDVVSPEMELRVYPDCDGVPDKTQVADVYPGRIGEGIPTPTFPGFNVHKVRFHLDHWVFGDPSGCDRLWFVPVGLTNNTKYFWISTDVGLDAERVQGAQGHFRAPTTVPAYPDWVAYEDYCPDPNFPICAGACIDYNFRVCGKICATLKDQSDFDLIGEAATKFPNVNDTGMSADNFQISPGLGSAEICRIEAWLATTCNPDLTFGTIFDNFCDKPGTERIALGFVDFWELTGDTFDGMPVYKFVWFCTGETLPKGRNYWFAPSSSRGVSIQERSVWLFRTRQELCRDIWITEGCYINWNDDVPAFQPVSELTQGNVARDFAFKIDLVDDSADGSVPQGDPGLTFDVADINRNGSVGLEDLQLLLFSFGNTTTP